jgi:hypothetical protein
MFKLLRAECPGFNHNCSMPASCSKTLCIRREALRLALITDGRTEQFKQALRMFANAPNSRKIIVLHMRASGT